MDENEKDMDKVKGGLARAEALTPEERQEIARKAANSRWGKNPGEVPEAINEGPLPLGDLQMDSYVLKDRRRVIHKRGLAKALGMKSEGGNVFLRTLSRKGLGSVITQKLREKIDSPIIFKTLNGDPAHGYEGSVLIDICDAIWQANKDGRLHSSQAFLATQAEIILRSSAKIGIIALIDEATGYIHDKRKEEYRELYKEFIRIECREWEKEFPDKFFDMIYRLYKLRKNPSARNHPQFFGKFIRKYIYTPLINSNGAILEMLDEKNPVVRTGGGRKYKMFQFLSDQVGLSAFRSHLWQIYGIGSASTSKEAFDRGFNRAFSKSGGQGELFEQD